MELEAKEALILRLFRAYPGGENKVSRETVNIYLKAVEWFPLPLIAEAVDRFATGQVDRKSRSFVPSADELATEIRNIRYAQGAGQRLLSQGRKQIEERDRDEEIWAERTPESVARIKAMVEAFAEQTAPKKTPEEIAAAKEMIRKTDAYFADDFVDTGTGVPVSRSLAKQFGYETFDSAEDDRYDLGGMK